MESYALQIAWEIRVRTSTFLKGNDLLFDKKLSDGRSDLQPTGYLKANDSDHLSTVDNKQFLFKNPLIEPYNTDDYCICDSDYQRPRPIRVASSKTPIFIYAKFLSSKNVHQFDSI